MQSSIDKRKQQELMHIEHQSKIYKKNYQGRPLIPKHISTYLQFTSFITQLIPIFNQHYYQALTQQENVFISQVTANIFEDMQLKLKNLAYRIQKIEIEQHNNKDVKTLCRACLHELREAEIAEAKLSLQGKEVLAQNIMKIIKEVEETSEPFTLEEDQRFFHELRAALKKKEEVIELCQSESIEFINMIDEQLKEILLNKDQLIMPEQRFNQSPEMKGYQLKENVTKSLKIRIDEKIPEIIKLVRTSLLKWDVKQRKLRSVHAQVQTADNESARIMDLKRKISSLQSELQQVSSEKTRIIWQLQEKSLAIEKYDKELSQLKEELNKKTYELQKEIKILEEKNRKFKEEIDKQKSRRNLDYTQNNFNSVNSFAQLKESSFAQQTPDQQLQEYTRKQKQKITIASASKTNGKFYLPTLKKIGNEDDMTMLRMSAKNALETEDPSFLQTQINPNNTSVRNITNNSNNSNEETPVQSSKISLSKSSSKNISVSKDKSRPRKKMERLMTHSNTKDSINEGDLLKKPAKLKTERATEGNETLNESQTLPMVKVSKNRLSNFNKKNGKQIKRLNNSLNKQQRQNNTIYQQNGLHISREQPQEREEMREQAREVSQKLKEKINERSNSVSSNSNSHKISNQVIKASIYKKNSQIDEASSSSIYQPQQTNLSSLITIKRTSTQKPYLRNSFSRINQEIDKQNYMTPLIESESVGVKDLQKMQESKTIKHHLFQIYREVSKESRQNHEINLEKFSQIFSHYVESIKSNEKDPKRSIHQARSRETTIHRAGLKNNQQIINQTEGRNQKDSEAYDGVSRLKKYHQQQDLELLKSRLEEEISKSKTKENSLNASYRFSPNYSEYQLQLSKTGKSGVGNSQANRLLVLQSALFFNEQVAFQYETSFSRKKCKITVLTPQIEHFLKGLFAVFEELKLKNAEAYHQVSGFLRYPYSHSQNGFLQLDSLKNLSLNGLTQCFLRILAYHKKCPVNEQVCCHMLNFKRILETSTNA